MNTINLFKEPRLSRGHLDGAAGFGYLVWGAMLSATATPAEKDQVGICSSGQLGALLPFTALAKTL